MKVSTKKSSKKSTKATKKIAKAKKEVPATKLYQGAPIPCNRLFVRKMDEFRNCEAWAWMAINDKEGTVTYGNSYGPDYGAFRASYQPEVYTFPIKEKVVAKKIDTMKELDPDQWPSFFTTAGRKRKGK
jgi:hypothetical protein